MATAHPETDEMMESRAREPRHSIRVVAGRTGLTPDAIRAWERRYGAVEPNRSPTRRRLYSDADVERLLLLRRAVDAGRRISEVAPLSTDELRGLVSSDEEARARVERLGGPSRRSTAAAGEALQACQRAIETLDAPALERALSEAAVGIGAPRMVDDLVMPLLTEVGERWRSGRLRPAHEHFLTSALRSFLGTLPTRFTLDAGAPRLVVTTPAGQLHELGALGAAVTAGLDGWQPVYLGPSLPAEDIALVAREIGSGLVALSIVFPPDDARLADELRRLRSGLPGVTAILVGGASADSYAEVLAEIGARHVSSFARFREELTRLR